ncbi:MAG: hypothetical protein OEW08_12700 [Gammaproteobacteria bacterium]|nr:hypothetical protein [Gammaproteobacteria bacterium]
MKKCIRGLVRGRNVSRAVLVVALFYASVSNVFADEQLRTYEYPLADMRANAGTYPSMYQSLRYSVDFYYLAHNTFADEYVFDKWQHASAFKRTWPIYLFDLLSLWTPLGVSWMHEEWHRAALSKYGVGSRNGVYDWPLFAEVISVDNVDDARLATLKAEHPVALVRAHAAGIESQYEMNLLFEKNAFFYNHRAGTQLIMWVNYANNISYLWGCGAGGNSARLTSTAQREEGTNVATRDFTGMDCDAWVYDLFRPYEPYASRGAHPSGVGVDRYRDYGDLTAEEKKYVDLQFKLSFINLVDPAFWGKKEFRDDTLRWNFSLRHHLAPFGYNLGMNVFAKYNQQKVFATVNWYSNKHGGMPGVDMEILRLPVNIFEQTSHVSARASAWYQPQGLLFDQTRWRPGGLLSFRLDVPLTTHLELTGEVYAKTTGWVPGLETLERDYGARVGIQWVTTTDARAITR